MAAMHFIKAVDTDKEWERSTTSMSYKGDAPKALLSYKLGASMKTPVKPWG